MVFSRVAMRRTSVEVRRILAPESEGQGPRTTGGSTVIPRPFHDPLWVGQPHQINPRMGCPTHKGSNGGGGSVFAPLVIGSTSLD